LDATIRAGQVNQIPPAAQYTMDALLAAYPQLRASSATTLPGLPGPAFVPGRTQTEMAMPNAPIVNAPMPSAAEYSNAQMFPSWAGAPMNAMNNWNNAMMNGAPATTSGGCPSLSENSDIFSLGGGNYEVDFAPTQQGMPLTSLQGAQLAYSVNSVAAPTTTMTLHAPGKFASQLRLSAGDKVNWKFGFLTADGTNCQGQTYEATINRA